MTDVEKMAKLAEETKLRNTLVCINSKPLQEEISFLERSLAENLVSFHFYIVSMSDGIWFEVIKVLRNIDHLIFREIKPDLEEVANYDFEGLQIPSISLSFGPFLQIGSCLIKASYCSASGTLVDLLGHLGNLYNFFNGHKHLRGGKRYRDQSFGPLAKDNGYC